MQRLAAWLVLLALLGGAIGYALHRRESREAAQAVDLQFTRCGYGRGEGCVVDGDTFKIGQRTLRVSGIDAPELAGQCPAEIAQAETATRALQDWLNRGPFTMRTPSGNPTDKYGRTLVSVSRATAHGEERLAAHLRDQGLARAYEGEARGGWC